MATVNYIPYQRQSAVSLGKVAGYVSQDEKTQDRRTGRKLVSGVRCSSHFAVQAHRQETGQRGALLFPLRCPGIPGCPGRPSQEKPRVVLSLHPVLFPKGAHHRPPGPPAGERIRRTGLAGEPGAGSHPCLSADLTQLLEANPEVEDSTTMRPQRRRKRALGEKPDEQDYQQKM